MSSKCTSSSCNRKSDSGNNQNLCVLCYDWFLKCQNQPQPEPQQCQNYQELRSIYNSLSNNIPVDHNVMMRALFGSMLNLMSQNDQIINLKEEIKTLESNVRHIESDLAATKVKVYNLEYDVKDNFTSQDTIVIRNLDIPGDGDEKKKVKEVLSNLKLEEVDLEENIIAVERKGSTQGRLGSVCVKVVDKSVKKQIMKNKKVLSERDIKIVNYKPPEQIILENAMRAVLALVPSGNQYELNGNMRLVTKN